MLWEELECVLYSFFEEIKRVTWLWDVSGDVHDPLEDDGDRIFEFAIFE